MPYLVEATNETKSDNILPTNEDQNLFSTVDDTKILKYNNNFISVRRMRSIVSPEYTCFYF